MGGSGSGRRRIKRLAVESSAVTVAKVSDVLKALPTRPTGKKLELDASVKLPAGAGRPPFTWKSNVTLVARNVGFGQRWFFLCPQCDHRRTALYHVVGMNVMACRECCGLTYASRQQSDARVNRLRRNPHEITKAIHAAGKLFDHSEKLPMALGFRAVNRALQILDLAARAEQLGPLKNGKSGHRQ